MKIWALVLAAGTGQRFLAAGVDKPKQFLDVDGVPLYWHCARVFAHVPEVCGIVFVMPKERGSESAQALSAAYTREITALVAAHPSPIAWELALGGQERQDSVRLGLEALPANCTHVLVHDAARPFLSGALVQRVIDGLHDGHAGVIPATEVTDTIKQVDADGMVTKTFVRSTLRAVQTPQGFSRSILLAAHAQAFSQGWSVTDDAELLEKCGIPVTTVSGDMKNIKITHPGDLAVLTSASSASAGFPCTGFGYDVHKYGGGRPFILGGVPIATNVTIAAHSDGDTLLHALMDAILGCIGGGDIGGMFPDSDPALEGISSGVLLAEVLEKSIREGLTIHHVDITVVAQVPRIGPHREAIARNVAKLLQLPAYAVNVKATTEEKLGFTGEKKGLKVMAVVTGTRRFPDIE